MKTASTLSVDSLLALPFDTTQRLWHHSINCRHWIHDPVHVTSLTPIAGLDLLKESVNVDCSYDMTPEQLCAKVSLVDALIIRSGTKASLTLSLQRLLRACKALV